MSTPDLHKRIYEFNFIEDEVLPSSKDIIKWLNYDIHNYPSFLDEAIQFSLDIITRSAKPKGGFVILTGEQIVFGKNSISIQNVVLDSEKIISRYFKNAQSLAIMLATIGEEPERISRKLISEGDPLTGYILDSVASLAVEKTADLVERNLNEIINSENLCTTNRYSPGYCGWNVSDQYKLFTFLSKEFCGIVLNESAMMIPVKSISAIVGIGEDVTKEEYDCELCDVDFCYKRNN